MTVELLELRLKDIELTDRAREDYQIDEDFLNSIREKGIIQPITVKRQGGTSSAPYRVLAGGRRYTAATELELATIPCIVRDSEGELDDLEIEFLENAQRKDLKWQEKMSLISRMHAHMIEKYGRKWGAKSKVAKILDRSVGGIDRVLKLQEMCDMFPALLEESTEDGAVRKSRKLMEAALVKHLSKQYKEQAEDTDGGYEFDLEEATQTEPGEGFSDDEYVQRCRRATSHYRIGNAFDGLQEMLDDGLHPPIALVEIDPPYAIDLKKQKKGELTRELDKYEEVSADKYKDWTYNLVELLDEVLPKDCRIIYWCGIEWIDMIKSCFETFGWNYDPIPGIWVKGTSDSQGSGQTNSPDHYLARAYETFLIASKGEGFPIQKRGRSNVFNFSPVSPKRKYHPTQRPIELMLEILQTFGWPGTILMVPFLGSGVTLRAAYKLNMLPFGWELNEENLDKFLAAIETDIQEYKTGGSNVSDIPF